MSSARPSAETYRLDLGFARLEALSFAAAVGGAPTLVFLHDGLGSVSTWRNFPARLAAATGCAALIYSRQGYGRSDPCLLPRPLDYMEQAASVELPAVLTAAGVQQYLLIGHSDGASIALIHAASDPGEGLLGVVSEAAHLFPEGETLDAIRSARDRYRAGELTTGLDRHHGTNAACAFEGWAQAWLDPRFVQWSIESILPRIQVPLLAMQGCDDPYGTPAQLVALRRRCNIPVECVLLAECRHTPHREQAERALHLMTRFVRRCHAAALAAGPTGCRTTT
ncbi:MAG: alpha/beta hydrolase [Pseudomonadota bacterium]|nr:alpha/beta hydrolase [Pseudomonadota bacterium]